MRDSDILVIGSRDVSAALQGREVEILESVKKAYQVHALGDSSLPHSTFLLFPASPADRIIALPAYLGGEANSAGVKWIASFPGNLDAGMDRASAVLILNSTATGRTKAIMEGSIVSAKRTAASAALGAQVLDQGKSTVAGLIGGGPINFEIARFLLAACPRLHTFITYDLKPERAQGFKAQCEEEFAGIRVKIANDVETIFSSTTLISFATTAGRPHIHSLASCAPGTTILHISLRDLAPEVILSADNVVDDADHVCRAQTSIHLTEQQVGHRNFMRCSLGEIFNGDAVARPDPQGLAIFSPFGLGILDLAVGEFVLRQTVCAHRGSVVSDFLPQSWSRVRELV